METGRSGVRDRVYRQLREDIIALRLEPGTMVSENELAERLGVSRMPVHDALMELSRSHLVDIYPQRGSRIALIDIRWVNEAAFIRRTLETAVAAELTLSITPQQLSQLEQSLARQETAMEQGELEVFLREDNDFHRMMYLFAGREETYRIVSNIMPHFDRIRAMTLHARPGQPLMEEHRQWLELLRTGDAGGLPELIRRHLGKYQEYIDSVLEQYKEYFQ